MIRPARAWSVFRKEMKDGFRDRKALFNVFFYAFIGPVVLLAVLAYAAKPLTGAGEEAIRLPTVGIDRAPFLIEALAERNIVAYAAEGDPRESIRTGAAEVALIIPETYPTEVREGKSATVQVITDRSRTGSALSLRRVMGTLEGYSRKVGIQRLLVRGIAPSVTSGLDLQVDEVSTAREQFAAILGSMPMFMLMALVMGSAFVAVDVTAGERERGSLEPLLANPVSDGEVMLGKLLAVAVFGAVAMLVCVTAFALGLHLAAAKDLVGQAFPISARAAVAIVLSLLPLSLLVAALEMVLASRAKTTREANTQIMLLTLLPLIPGLAMMFGRVSPALTALPLFGQQVFIFEVIRGSEISVSKTALCVVSTVLTAVLLALVGIGQQRRARTRPDSG